MFGRIAEGTRAKAVRLKFNHSWPRPLVMIGNLFQSSPTGTYETFDFDVIWSRDLHKILEAGPTRLIQLCVNEGLNQSTRSGFRQIVDPVVGCVPSRRVVQTAFS